jgi:hypothetical protein
MVVNGERGQAFTMERVVHQGCPLTPYLYWFVADVMHYNNKGVYCDPNIIANNKERIFRKPAVANHNSSQTLKLL